MLFIKNKKAILNQSIIYVMEDISRMLSSDFNKIKVNKDDCIYSIDASVNDININISAIGNKICFMSNIGILDGYNKKHEASIISDSLLKSYMSSLFINDEMQIYALFGAEIDNIETTSHQIIIQKIRLYLLNFACYIRHITIELESNKLISNKF